MRNSSLQRIKPYLIALPLFSALETLSAQAKGDSSGSSPNNGLFQQALQAGNLLEFRAFKFHGQTF